MRGAAALLLMITLAGCGGGVTTSPSPNPPPVASSAAGGASTNPAETPGGTGIQLGDSWPTAVRWSQPSYLSPGDRATDMVAWRDEYVAVGTTLQGARTAAAAWVTKDWANWHRMLVDLPADGDSSIERVIAVDSQLIAIGTSGTRHCVPREGEGQRCDPLAIALWSSANGQSWRREPRSPAFAGVYLTAVATNGSSAVLVGDRGWDRPGIWASDDGLTWGEQSLPHTALGDDQGFAGGHFLDVAASSGGWVIVGFEGGTEPQCCEGNRPDKIPAAWFSLDGRSWRRADVVNAVDDVGFMLQRVFVGDSYLAYSGPDPERWVSDDGLIWMKAANATVHTPSPWASDGAAIVGRSSDSAQLLHLSISADGVGWRVLADTGAVAEAPTLGATRVAADTALLFASGIGILGEDGTGGYPIWYAQLIADPSATP